MAVSVYTHEGRHYLKARIVSGAPRLSLRAAVASRAEAEARATLLEELLEGLEAAGQAVALREDVARKIALLPEGPELAAHVRFVREQLCTGAYVRGERPSTVRELADQWTSGALARRYPDRVKVKRSADQDARTLRLYVLPVVGDLPVPAVGLGHLEAVMGALPSRLGPAARRHVAQTLARLLALAVYPCRIIGTSPVPRGWLPRLPRTQGAYLYPAEEARLLGCTAVPLVRRLAYGLLTREGMRKEELQRLTWGAVDLERGVLTLARHKTSDTTGARAWRLGGDVQTALGLWWVLQPSGWHPSRPILPSFSVSNLAKQLRRDLKAAGVDRAELFQGEGTRHRLRAHDLRATFVTLALAAGRSEQWVTDRTGHTSSEVLARYRRGARLAGELDLGWLAPLHEALPELSTGGLRGDAAGAGVDGTAEKGGLCEGGDPVVCLEIMCTRKGTEGSNPSLSAENDSFEPAPPVERRPAIDRETLLALLEEADRVARALDLPRVRIRVVNALAEARR